MTNTITGLDGAHELLIKLVDQTPDDWAMRRKVAKVLFDARYYRDASQMIWSAPEIPPNGEDIVFSARIVAKGQPTRAMRLINTVIDKNLGQPEENLDMAKLFMKADMPLQAIRFYGAAVALDAKLIDERFEVCLLNADVESLPWTDEVMGEDFPWEGPRQADDAEPLFEDQEAHEALLNGLTQPVPLKATPSQPGQGTARVEARVEARDPEPERKLPTWKVQEGRAVSDPNNFSHAKVSSGEAGSAADETDAAGQPPAPAEANAELAGVAEVAEVAEVADDAAGKDPGAEAKAETAPVAESVAPVADAVEDAPVEDAPVEDAGSVVQPAFFKSYDAAHQHMEDSASSQAVEIAPEEEAEPAAEAGEGVFQIDPGQPGDDGIDDYVAGAMAEYESSSEKEDKPREGGVVSAFSSLVSRFCRKKPAEAKEPEELEPADELPEYPVVVDLAKEPVAQEAQPSAPAADAATPPAAPAPEAPKPAAESGPSPLDRPGVHTSAQKLVSKSQPEPELPKELDGRTQLVALAPEDGTPYFEQLVAKYQNVEAGQVPRAVVVARDMANADYLKLIHQACEKDLDAFSKLLGLHRAMAANNCRDWGEDMNLLRKGYGDAVLATVVSKYSVSECREILNSVYRHPAPAAAAV